MEYFSRLAAVLEALPPGSVEELAGLIYSTYQAGGTIFLFGNGGSAANASHFAGDLVKGGSLPGKKRFKAMCLSDNQAASLAIANDISYEAVFREQLENFLQPGDLVIGVSGSGNSPNVLRGIEYANQHEAVTFGLTAFGGGKLAPLAKHSLIVPVHDMEMAEDCHLAVFHAVKQALKAKLMAEE